MSELHELSVGELIGGYINRTFSPVEVCRTLLDRAHAVQQTIAPFVELFDDEVMTEAKASERRYARGEAGPLDGVPIPIKDNVAVAGHRMRAGSAAVRPHTGDMDAAVVARLRRAGGILFGRTTCPEFSTLPATEWVGRPPTRNPFHLDYVPGGSSGGSAAAVAAGAAPAAHGNDGAGSLRIPASCCGLVGIKPTRGRIPLGPVITESPGGMICEGFLTRSVADQARLLDATMGPLGGDPWRAPQLDRPVLAMPRRAGPLRVGVTLDAPLPVPVDAECARAAKETAAILEARGHVVREVQSPWEHGQLADLFGLVWAAVITWVSDCFSEEGLDVSAIEPHNAALREMTAQTALPTYLAAQDELARYSRGVMALWEELDVLVTPTLATPPIKVGTILQNVQTNPMAPIERALGFVPFTPVPNLTGQPAASVPMHVDADTGLPIGVQLIADFGHEDVLLGVAAELEPYFQRPPLATGLLGGTTTTIRSASS